MGRAPKGHVGAPSGVQPGPGEPLLDSLREALKHRGASARSTAALLDNPGCVRRAVLDSARVDLADLASRLGAATQFGQSPFAIGQGNRFERRVKEDDYSALIKAMNDLLGIFVGLNSIRTANLEQVPVLAEGQRLIEARAEATAEVLVAIATGATTAPHVVDHGVTTLEVGGVTVYLEQDALAFREGEALRICEIKGFPIIDGTAHPAKVGAAARQTAVYVASIQDTLARHGLDPGMVSTEVVLICPRNFSIAPTAVTVDVGRELRALRRQLHRHVAVEELIRDIEAQSREEGLDLLTVIDVVAKDGAQASDSLRVLVSAMPYRYAPECLTACDLARHCRQCAVDEDSPARLGGEVLGLVGDLGSIGDALRLRDDPAPPEEMAEVAALLQGAQRAVQDLVGVDEFG